jgi:hypothetical protein
MNTARTVISWTVTLRFLLTVSCLVPSVTAVVVRNKPWYTWIYATVLADERRIAEVVDRHQLRVP